MTARRFQFGPAVQQGGTHFSLWAPGAHSVALEIEGREPLPMAFQTGGWHEAEAPVGAGARYRFRLPDGALVPDPASRFQPEDVHGPSLVTSPDAYGWQCESDRKSVV